MRVLQSLTLPAPEQHSATGRLWPLTSQHMRVFGCRAVGGVDLQLVVKLIESVLIIHLPV